MFLFKGSRNYLHSLDIFYFINNKYSCNHLDIKFNKLLKSQPKIKFTKKLENNHNASIVTQIKEKKSKKFSIFYDSNININNYSYNENLLNKFFKINSDGVKCNFYNTISYIDLIVPMTTKWHLSKIGKK